MPTHTVTGLRADTVKALVKQAKALGFKARYMPYMANGCSQPGFANLNVDYSSFGGQLPEKLRAMGALKNAIREARLSYYD